MRLKVSQFCHVVRGRSRLSALYNALTLGVVVADESIAKIVDGQAGKILSDRACADLKLHEGLLEQMLRHKLVFPSEEQIDEEDYLTVQKHLSCNGVGILYLLVTDACNLACTYCFVENAMPEGYKHSRMKVVTAKAGIDLFVSALSRSDDVEEPQIIFYGGEPLSNFHVVREALDYIAQLKRDGDLPQSTSITINTNGTLITPEIAAVLKNVENLNIAISLDGPEEVHNLCRPYHSGLGTYVDVVRGYRLLSEAGVGAGLCCTISRFNIDHLQEITRWFIEEFNVQSMGFNILIESLAVPEVAGELDTYSRKVAAQLISCFKILRDAGIYEDRFMRKVNAFVDGKIYYYDCGGCGQQIVVSPDGMVGVCQGYCGSKKYFVKPDETFDPLNHPIWKEWRRRSPLSMPQCKDCIALGLCGGGCPYSADMRRGSIWELDDVFCVHAKETTTFLIHELTEQMTTD